MKDCKQLYLELNQLLGGIINETLNAGNLLKHSESYNFIGDFEKWIIQLSNSNEVILYKYALLEYQHALLLVVQGMYRQAFNSLRFCLEHICFGIYLSVNEYDFRRWKAGQLDVYWSNIIEENSVFSKPFINLFAPELSDKATELKTLAKVVYRECSEFTHGNYNVAQLLSEELSYNEDLFLLWQDKAETVRYIVTMMLFIRYKDYIQDNNLVAEFESVIMDYIGTLPEIQAFYEVAKRMVL